MAHTLNLKTMTNPMKIPPELADHPIFAGPYPVGMVTADAPKVPPQITGGTKAMAKELERMGLQHELTNGKYNGQTETSFLVHNPTREQMMELGQKFGQESVVFTHNGNHEMIYTNGANKGKWNPGLPGGEYFKDPPADFFTQIPQKGYLRLDFDWNNLMDLPQTQEQDVTKAEVATALLATLNKAMESEKEVTREDVAQGLAKAIQNRIDAFTQELVELRKKETGKALHPTPDLPGEPVPVPPVKKCGAKCTKKGELSLDLAPVKDTSDKKPAVPEKTKEIDTTEGSGGDISKGKMKKGVMEFSGEDIAGKSGNVGGTSQVQVGRKSTIPAGVKKPVAAPANETTFAPSSKAPSGLVAPQRPSTIPTGLRRPAAAGVGMTSSGKITDSAGAPAPVRAAPAPMRFSEKENMKKGAEGVPEAKPPTAPGGKPAKPPSGNAANKPVKQAPAAPKPIKPMKTGVAATPSVTAPANVNKP